ncbi:PspA/IM30 family protein [Methylomicrobium sp. Wu6]|uniref:PspA/IM30 family protein n=1 Tax=Methylomicrobium sp. Wu6 TaxID=3107928 RepID=UPI002DD63FA2|nr:PspA/IM30 family protein [Methylomicrobium sp. Wu6]MEC4746979.1 PspA/IM30 family protein [Methylomicrobium sp. Wu6]
MALITRLARLFQADMHAVLDKIEEPAMLLKHSIREMEDSIIADEKQIRLWEYEQRQLASQRDRLEESLGDLEAKCALCFKSGKDDLARSFIKRKLETQQAKQVLAEKITALQEKISRLIHQLMEHQAQLTAMKQKAEVFLEEKSS